MTNFEGHFYPDEHRTVGAHRAWSFLTNEWCYPDEPCAACADHMRDTRPCPHCDGKGYLEED